MGLETPQNFLPFDYLQPPQADGLTQMSILRDQLHFGESLWLELHKDVARNHERIVDLLVKEVNANPEMCGFVETYIAARCCSPDSSEAEPCVPPGKWKVSIDKMLDPPEQQQAPRQEPTEDRVKQALLPAEHRLLEGMLKEDDDYAEEEEEEEEEEEDEEEQQQSESCSPREPAPRTSVAEPMTLGDFDLTAMLQDLVQGVEEFSDSTHHKIHATPQACKIDDECQGLVTIKSL